ncbi:centrosomal protein of 72 kDa isoform X5 [Phycodurus eques]|uniref:centrosomal protein of 72 kDa isoform X5 n=1 Tax=Phycodurus eques TaxID=693459 RepID=UPI002ACDBC4D|nr:centrosomal protein of 72 kDa isoform X5 [Phycodurus eques]
MAPLTLMALTEEWIMNKVGLNHQRLGDVRSLSLPGTYKQKIGYLGNGLANFERLKSLNLSHNSLVSLEGLQHLKHLQILNLYYNCIPSLEEVKVLFELSVLRELDLRLNPLGKIYPHYRPFVVHAIASLRKLDGCPVKDAERKAAKKRCSQLRKRDDRQALVERLSMKLSLLSDKDDVGSNHADVHRNHSYSNEELESTHKQSAQDHQCPSPHHSGSNPFLYTSWLTKAENKQQVRGCQYCRHYDFCSCLLSRSCTCSSYECSFQDSYRKPLEELLDVMDKHWVGKRTLQLNTNFLTQIVQILSMMENHISRRAQHAAEDRLGGERRPPKRADHVRTYVSPVYDGAPAHLPQYRGSEKGGGAEEGGGRAEEKSEGGSRASRIILRSDLKCAGM